MPQCTHTCNHKSALAYFRIGKETANGVRDAASVPDQFNSNVLDINKKITNRTVTPRWSKADHIITKADNMSKKQQAKKYPAHRISTVQLVTNILDKKRIPDTDNVDKISFPYKKKEFWSHMSYKQTNPNLKKERKEKDESSTAKKCEGAIFQQNKQRQNGKRRAADEVKTKKNRSFDKASTAGMTSPTSVCKLKSAINIAVKNKRTRRKLMDLFLFVKGTQTVTVGTNHRARNNTMKHRMKTRTKRQACFQVD